MRFLGVRCSRASAECPGHASGHARLWAKQEVQEPSRSHPWDRRWRLGAWSTLRGGITGLTTVSTQQPSFLSRLTARGKEGIKSGRERERN